MTDATAQMVPAETAQQYAQDRRAALPALHQMCQIMGYPAPGRFTEEERILVRLTSKWLTLLESVATQQIDRALVPILLQETTDANVPREGLSRERVRHVAATAGGAVTSAIAGAVMGMVNAVIDTMILSFTHLAVVFVPGLITFLLACLVSTAANREALTGEIIQQIVVSGAWVGLLASGLSTVLFCAWQAYRRHEQREASEARRRREVPNIGGEYETTN